VRRSQSTKKVWQLDCLFCTFGICVCNSCSWRLDEIDPCDLRGSFRQIYLHKKHKLTKLKIFLINLFLTFLNRKNSSASSRSALNVVAVTTLSFTVFATNPHHQVLGTRAVVDRSYIDLRDLVMISLNPAHNYLSSRKTGSLFCSAAHCPKRDPSIPPYFLNFNCINLEMSALVMKLV
jgi:hypothetical protein